MAGKTPAERLRIQAAALLDAALRYPRTASWSEVAQATYRAADMFREADKLDAIPPPPLVRLPGSMALVERIDGMDTARCERCGAREVLREGTPGIMEALMFSQQHQHKGPLPG